MNIPKRRINPDHLHDTAYPFFWVQPLVVAELETRDYRVGDSWDNDEIKLYGLYRYNKPNASDGISFPTWISDFEDVETADAIAAALNIVVDVRHIIGGTLELDNNLRDVLYLIDPQA